MIEPAGYDNYSGNTNRQESGGALLPAPAKIYGTCIHLIEDIVQDFLLFERGRKIVVTQGSFDLSDYIAYIGHGF